MNRSAFAEQYSLHKDRLVRRLISTIGNHEIAEDIASAAFATAFRKLDTFRNDSAVSTWIHAIAMNELRSLLRKKRTVSLESIEIPGRKEFVEPDHTAQIHDRMECIHRLRRVLRRVPMMQRRMLTDHFVHGFSIAQIATRYRIPKGTVLSRIFNGKQKLRQAWEG